MTTHGARRGLPIPAVTVLRVFFGIVYLTNGLAKVTAWRELSFGPAKNFLIDFNSSRGIYAHDVKSTFGPYQFVATHVVLPNYSVFGHLLGALEIAVGLGLVLGVFGRIAALGGALLTLNVQLAAIGGGEWAFEYLVELVPLLYLAAVPSGHLPFLEHVPLLRRTLPLSPLSPLAPEPSVRE